MPWLNRTASKDYPWVYWIHPLKQGKVEGLIKKIERDYPEITRVVIFGSSTREDCTDFSDIDVVIWGMPGKPFVSPCDDVYDVLHGEDLHKGMQIVEDIEEDGVLVYEK